MPPSNSPSAPYRRTRRDHASETAEDYVEAIEQIERAEGACRAVDLARRFGVSHVTVSRILTRLSNLGFVRIAPYQPVRLSPRGARLAKQSRERHEIVYGFLLTVGVDPETAAIDAEGIEHHVSPETLNCFKEFTRRARRV